MAIKKYIGSVVNLANQFSQATRPKHVGQMSDLIQQYRCITTKPSVEDWQQFYFDLDGEQKIDEATEKIYAVVESIRENLNDLSREDIRAWAHDLIINKTYAGLAIQQKILESLAVDDWRLATKEEESKGIDGFIDGEPVSIKPESYKSKSNSKTETIACRIIYYKKTNSKKGFKIVE